MSSSPGQPIDFPPIEISPGKGFETIHRFYLLLEPDMIAAIQRRDLGEARRLINHVLVHIYSIGEERSEFLKFLLLEIVVMLSRRAIEAGGASGEIVEFGLTAARDLAAAEDDEVLAEWLRRTLDGLMRAFPKNPVLPAVVERAVKHMRDRACERLTRESVAAACGVSDAHLNEVLKKSTGRSFREVLRDVRVQRACELLSASPAGLAEVAAACGFCDQSHLTRVFRESRGVTPREYREKIVCPR